MHQLTQPRIIYIVMLIVMTLFLITMIKAPPHAQAHNIKYPIIIIPGFSGTSLQAPDIGASADDIPDGHGGTYNHVYDPFEEIWVNRTQAALPGNDDYFDILGLNPDGQTPYSRLGLKEIIPEIYQTTTNYFINKGYVLNRDLYTFPYDWRMDIRENDERLDNLIETAKSKTGLAKVNVIAHSMGGLILRNYINDPQKAAKINSAVTLGTPFLGAPELLKWLKYGGCVKFPVGPACLTLASSETKDILQNMPAAYQLMPSKKYYEIYSGKDTEHPLPYTDGTDSDENGIKGELSYIQLKEFLTNLGYNTSLFTQAEQLHDAIDTSIPQLPNGSFTLLIGSGKPTIGQIEEHPILSIGNVQINKKDEHIINGDGTVPLHSAMLSDLQSNFNLTGNAKVYFTNKEHNKLPSDPDTLNFINFIFSGNTNGTYQFNQITTTPTPLKGHLISVHSPVKIDIYDQSGYHTGLNDYGNPDLEIPDSSYEELDDAKFIWVPKDGNYTIKINPTDQGTFDLKIRDYTDNKLRKEQDYENIPVQLGTSGMVLLNTAATTPPVLQMDTNADGNLDTNISPTYIKEDDIAAPTSAIQLEGKIGRNNWYGSDVTTTLTVSDNPGGSGVEKIVYALNYGPQITYTQPFIVSQEGINQIQYFAVDKTGNTETIHQTQIKIDKSSPEGKVLFNPQTQNIELTGTDSFSHFFITENQIGTAIIEDEAGNKITIAYSPKDKKKKQNIQIESIQYDNNSPIIPSENELKANYEPDKKTGNIKQLQQKLTIKGENKIETEYQEATNTTKVEQKTENTKKEKQQIDGIGIIKIFTNKGSLESEVSV